MTMTHTLNIYIYIIYIYIYIIYTYIYIHISTITNFSYQPNSCFFRKMFILLNLEVSSHNAAISAFALALQWTFALETLKSLRRKRGDLLGEGWEVVKSFGEVYGGFYVYKIIIYIYISPDGYCSHF